MSQLNLLFLGTPHINRDGVALFIQTRKIVALLAYLAVTQQVHSRDTLLTLLWPESNTQRAKSSLRHALSTLKKTIGEEWLIIDRYSVGLNWHANIQLDVAHFHQLIADAPTKESLTQAVALYRDDFLAGFSLPDSPAFDEWQFFEMENLRQLLAQALEKMIDFYEESQSIEIAISYGRRWVALDPLHEPAHIRLMQLYAQSGQRATAVRQFEECHRILEQELGIPPSNEVTLLYNQIQAGLFNKVQAHLELHTSPSPSPHSPTLAPVFLYTDIEDSTRLWDKHRQAMLPTLLHHNNLIQTQIQQHGGKVLDYTGDGVLAVFEQGDPLQCAIDIQKQLHQEDWGDVDDLRVRIGLHSVAKEQEGQAYFRQHDRFYGSVLNHASRITDTAWGGQIVLSAYVKEILSLPIEARYHDLGQHRLRGLDELQHIFELYHPTLPKRTFPPLRTQSIAASPHHNLPTQRMSFVGRERELSEITAVLSNPDHRLLTLTGPGGIGKTRLALEAAVEQIGQFAHGVYYVDLTPLRSANLLASTVANTIGLTLRGPNQPKEQLLNYLKDKEMLLLLDNFEHLLDGVTLVSELLRHAPFLIMLVTSRELLNLQEEWLYPITGLPYPLPRTELGDEEPIVIIPTEKQAPATYSAIKLFTKRARQVQPNFSLPPVETAVVRICQLVEGMPLGLELAAAWVRMLSCDDIAQEIARNFDFLTTMRRDVNNRHRSLRAVFEYSWNLLLSAEQQTLAQLSVFRGGFTREAALHITQASLFTLYGLINKSLLHRTEDNRYNLHELLRQFAAEKLLATPDLELTTKNSHATYYGNYLHQLEKLWDTEQEKIALNAMRADLQNIRTGWHWATTQCQEKVLDHYIHSLYDFYMSNNWYREGEETFALAAINLVDATQLPDHVTQPNNIVLAKVLTRQAHFNQNLGRPEATTQLTQQSLAILEQTSNHLEASFAYNILGSVNYYEGNYTKAMYNLKQSFQMVEKTDDRSRKANLCLYLGSTALALGNHHEAHKWYKLSLDIYQDIKKMWGVAHAMRGVGQALYGLKGFSAASDYFKQSLTIFQNIQNSQGMVICLNQLGFMAQERGNYSQAKQWFQESLVICQENDMPVELARTMNYLGDIATLMNRYQEAESYLHHALKITTAIKSPPLALQTLLGTATLLLKVEGQTPISPSATLTTEMDTINNRVVKAFELLTLIVNHPATHQDTRNQAKPRLHELVTQLPPPVVASLQEKIARQGLESTIIAMLTNGESTAN